MQKKMLGEIFTEVKNEMKENRKMYLYVFAIFFFFAVLVEYRILISTDINLFNLLFIYSTMVFTVLTVKYIGSLFHTTERWQKYSPENDVWPSVDIVIPAFNEGESIYDTVSSIVKADYEKNKINIILVNDGSDDNTNAFIEKAVRDFRDFNIHSVNREENAGKKVAMAVGILGTSSDYVVFIDSDSFIEKNCLKEIVRPFFKDKNIGAVSGHALVKNSDQNLLTKMQEIRYFNAFRSGKAVESLLGFVSCCPGCCSAYRREAILPIMYEWLEQSFLGAKCTYGDDRSLTNLVLKNNWEVVYNEMAVVYTIVPDNLKTYNKQQIRWKKSWLRESVVVLSFVWKRNPFTALLMILETITPFFAPIVMLYIFFYLSFVSQWAMPRYLFGVLVFATCLGLYYKIHNKYGSRWWLGGLYSSFIAIVFFWQLPYALFTLRDTKWGTR